MQKKEICFRFICLMIQILCLENYVSQWAKKNSLLYQFTALVIVVFIYYILCIIFGIYYYYTAFN